MVKVNKTSFYGIPFANYPETDIKIIFVGAEDGYNFYVADDLAILVINKPRRSFWRPWTW